MRTLHTSSASSNPARRKFFLSAAAGAAAIALPSLARAQLGANPGRILVGFAAGGPGDLFARTLVEELRDLYPKGLIVENKPGASGRLAIDAMKTAEPDGNTLLYSPSSILTILPHAVKGGAFQPMSFLQPVAGITRQDFVVVLGPSSGARTLAEFLAAAKSDPKKASYGTAGAGTPQHLIGYLLGTAAGMDLAHVPYKGGGAALQDALAGHVPMVVSALSGQLMGLHREGKLHIVAVAGAKRSALVPAVPSLQEQGLKGIAVDDWGGLLVPARTPAATVERISAKLVEMAGRASYVEALGKGGQEPLATGPAAYGARLSEELARWAPVIKAVGFSMES